jgi:hypothetical protein
MTETISDALKIEKGWVESTSDYLETIFEKHETISEIMEDAGKFTREEELGEVDCELSRYEKKLMMLGVMIGSIKARSAMDLASNQILFEMFKRFKEENGEE